MIHDIAEDYTRELLANIREKVAGVVLSDEQAHSISAAEIEDHPSMQEIEEGENQP